MNTQTTQERLLDTCKKLLAIVVAPELFTEEKRRVLIDEARSAIHCAQAEKN